MTWHSKENVASAVVLLEVVHGSNWSALMHKKEKPIQYRDLAQMLG
jgi:hypothetical protein